MKSIAAGRRPTSLRTPTGTILRAFGSWFRNVKRLYTRRRGFTSLFGFFSTRHWSRRLIQRNPKAPSTRKGGYQKVISYEKSKHFCRQRSGFFRAQQGLSQ